MIKNHKKFNKLEYMRNYSRNKDKEKQAEYQKKYRKEKLDKEKNRSYRLKSMYGISVDQYNELLEKQENKCFVCQKNQSDLGTNLHIDHDHKTGEIRGLLCNYCNRRVIANHTDSEKFYRAAKYLEGPFTGWFVPKRKKRRSKSKLKKVIEILPNE